jgi:methionine-rich copper-binding protein CopC
MLAMRLAAVCLMLGCGYLWAHAILVESTPAVRGVVEGPDLALRLKFNSRIDASRSRLYLVNGGASRQIKIIAQPSPDTLEGHVKGLVSGDAVVRWQVLAADGHITRGELPFQVR